MINFVLSTEILLSIRYIISSFGC